MRLLLILYLAIFTQVFAGSGDAEIKCQTSSKRTQVEMHVLDITGGISKVSLSIDNKSYTFHPKQDDVIADNNVYILIAKDDKRVFKMWMIPNTEKILHESYGIYKSQFAAKIIATDPRKKNKYEFTPRITIGCTLDYSI